MDQELLIVSDTETLVVESDDLEIAEVAEQGPPGPPGLDGSAVVGAFLVVNRFFEIAADETAKQTARTNLGLSTIDGGEFF